MSHDAQFDSANFPFYIFACRSSFWATTHNGELHLHGLQPVRWQNTVRNVDCWRQFCDSVDLHWYESGQWTELTVKLGFSQRSRSGPPFSERIFPTHTFLLARGSTSCVGISSHRWDDVLLQSRTKGLESDSDCRKRSCKIHDLYQTRDIYGPREDYVTSLLQAASVLIWLLGVRKAYLKGLSHRDV